MEAGEQREQDLCQLLPEGVLENILGRLSAPQLSQARLACRRLAEVGAQAHLPPRQEQLQLALARLADSALVAPSQERGGTNSDQESDWGRLAAEALLGLPGAREVLRHMAALQLLDNEHHRICLRAGVGLVELVARHLAGSAALRDLRLREVVLSSAAAAALESSGVLQGLERLDLVDIQWIGSGKGPWDLLRAPGLCNIRTLSLSGFYLHFSEPPDVAAILSALTDLQTLSLDLPAADAGLLLGTGGAVLTASMQLARLSSLDLRGPSDSEDMLAEDSFRSALLALAQSTTTLTHLGLPRHLLGDELVLELARAPVMRGLTSLDLERNDLTAGAVLALVCEAASYGRLRTLNLANNCYIKGELPPAGGVSPPLTALAHLDLSLYYLDDDGAVTLPSSAAFAPLLSRSALPALLSLALEGPLSNEVARCLPTLDGLTSLRLLWSGPRGATRWRWPGEA